jgi:hypothetical protein
MQNAPNCGESVAKLLNQICANTEETCLDKVRGLYLLSQKKRATGTLKINLKVQYLQQALDFVDFQAFLRHGQGRRRFTIAGLHDVRFPNGFLICD